MNTERGMSDMWHDMIGVLIESISAESFREDLAQLREAYGDSPDDIGAAHASALTHVIVETAGLFAAVGMPPEEVPAALAEIRETLAHLDFEGERRRFVRRDKRRYYERFSQIAAPLFADLGEAMEALFTCYVAGDYDPQANPDDLVAEGLEIADDDIDRARLLITQAAAIALDSRPLWWRWGVEAYGAAEHWLHIMFNLVLDYTNNGEVGLGPIEEARARAEATAQQAIKELEEKKKEEELEPTLPPVSPADAAGRVAQVDELIEDLIKQGEARPTPGQLAFCQAHSEETIPALIEIATDEYLQMEDSPGYGYAPIHAVELLGELQAAEAVPALIDIAADTHWEAIISNAAVFSLKHIGPPAFEPVLKFMRYSWDTEAKTTLAEVITQVGHEDGQAYQTIVTVWNETTWEEGKCLLANALARVGGERAIPLLEAALEDPDLDKALDYNEVVAALEELGVEVPPTPADRVPLDMLDMGTLTKNILLDVGDPEHLMSFAEAVPGEWRANPEALAHAYSDIERARLNTLLAMQVILLPPEMSIPLLAVLLANVEALAFDAPTKGFPRRLRQTYAHLAKCAGPAFRLSVAGVLIALQHYLSENYDIADDPDQLLLAARELSPEGDEVREMFGRAGALILHGRPFWPRWPAETDYPVSGWLEGLVDFRRPLERIGQIPLLSPLERDATELSAALMEAMEEEEPPPQVAELLDVLLAQEQDILPPAERRRFFHRRAAVIPHLIHIVEDRNYWYEDGPGNGWAAILAVRLLGALKAGQAANALVSAVAGSGPGDIIHDAALFSLMKIGQSALPAVQAYFRYGRDMATKVSLAEVMGYIGKQNPNSFNLLQHVWDAAGWADNRRVAALAFGDLGDRRAIPLLQAALDDQSADALDLDYVHWALLRLGVPAPSALPQRHSRLRTPAPHNPRLVHDELDVPQRMKYNAWGEPLCPDCGQSLVQDANGVWTHAPTPPRSSSSGKTKSKRRKKKRRR
jgi:HEAT repeat protein